MIVVMDSAAPPAPAYRIDLPLTGANGGTSFPDGGSLGLAWAAEGNAQTSTAINAAGDLLLDGAGDAIVASVSNFTMTVAGGFRISFKARKSANGANSYDIPIACDTTASGFNGFFVELSSTRGFGLAYNGNFANVSLNPNDSTTHEWAIERLPGSTSIEFFRDGVSLGTAGFNFNIANTSGQIKIGRVGSNPYDFNGHIWDAKVAYA